MTRARGPLVLLVLGILALVAVTIAGWEQALHALVVSPPPAVRLLLGTSAALLGLVLVLRSAERLGKSAEPRELVRAVRIVFLAVAAFAAAAGWYLASPLPVVVAVLIAGVDIIETSFLLLVTAVRTDAPR